MAVKALAQIVGFPASLQLKCCRDISYLVKSTMLFSNLRSGIQLHVHSGRRRLHDPRSDALVDDAQAEPDDAAADRLRLPSHLILLLLDLYEDETARLPSKLRFCSTAFVRFRFLFVNICSFY